MNLVGRLVKDPELLYTKDGVALSKFSVAVQRNYKNQKGEYDTDFIPCTLWKRSAERLATYCGKGSMISVNGRLQTRIYENQEQKRIFTMDMIAEGVSFLQVKPPNASALQETGQK